MNRILKSDHLYEKVLEVLIEYYEEEKIRINEKLPTERELSDTLSVSRNTIRDAYRYLEIKNYLITKSGGGRILVKALDKNIYKADVLTALRENEIRNLLEIREILEVGLIDYILLRSTKEELLKLKKEIEKSGSIYDSDFDFHIELAKLSKNDAAVEYYRLNKEMIEYIKIKNYDENTYNYYTVHDEHYNILEALISNDRVKARALIKQHLSNIYKRFSNDNQEDKNE
ncbi:FadR/GntR family transcriptional regulator [Jeotgalicoccus sp. FSL K6-3177]|uniref:FadR/GntR family transcriptional regulator n=1 Tax=Jeotgalicoccus sp. FSL K6-3177 TaxID=2921494 RepID=UPI0030FD9D22